MAPKITVGYYDARGRAESIRLTLKYAGVDFEDKRYTFDMANRLASDWFKVKPTLGLDFPNVPYLMDGDVKLTQTLAILRYLGRKYHLDGTNETERNRIAMLEQQVVDLINDLAQILFHKKDTATPEDKAAFVKQLETDKLSALDKFLGTAKWSSGSDDHLSYVDFWLYEYLHAVDLSDIAGGVVQKFAHLKGFLARVEALPQLAAYLKELNAKPKMF